MKEDWRYYTFGKDDDIQLHWWSVSVLWILMLIGLFVKKIGGQHEQSDVQQRKQ